VAPGLLFLSDYYFKIFYLFSIKFWISNVEDNSNLQLTKQATLQPSRTTTTYVLSSMHYAPSFVCLCFGGVIFLCIVKFPWFASSCVDISEQQSAGGANEMIIINRYE
jgi:hypothetical protein